MPDVPAQALLSFIKQVSVEPFWDTKRVTEILNVKWSEAAQIVATLEMLGYAEPALAKKNLWRNTPAGNTVSGARPPRFNKDSVLKALKEVCTNAERMNADHESPFRVTELVAFGDFLDEHPKVQAADVGVALVAKSPEKMGPATAQEQRREEHVLRDLRGRSTMLQLHALEDWMCKRSRHVLLGRN